MTVMDQTFADRDYSLTGPESDAAVAKGLASADWYHSDVPRKEMKALMRRSDAAADRDTVLWIGLLVLTGCLGVLLWGTGWAVLFFAAYGVLYGSACDSRWHECGHGTAFKTEWKNDAVYHIASFMVMRNPIAWRWSHARHHTDTIIVGRDPEIAVMRPPDMVKLVLKFVGLPDAYFDLKRLGVNALGRLTADELEFIPESERGKAVYWARVHVGIYVATVVVALVTWSWAPVLLIGGPRIYGCWHMVLMGLMQHGGMAEDVLDHRLNSRTVLINPVSRWLYWNMNYHVEHHMFPMVPYHALPALHARIKGDLPAPDRSIVAAYRAMIGALLRQQREPGYAIRPVLPATARAFREDLHDLDVARGGA